MWQIVYEKTAIFAMQKFDPSIRRTIDDRLTWFAEHFENLTPLPLTGELRGYFKFRIGDFRAIYTVDWNNKIIFVRTVGKRDDVYKNFP